MNTPQPTLTVRNSTVVPAAPLTYDFEIYSDAELTQPVAVATDIDEQLGLTTSYQVRFNLQENASYYWRARAFNGVLYSQWVNGEFFVNNIQEPPGNFVINNPVDGAEVDSLTPLLSVANSVDPDDDPLTYVFEVFADENLTTLVTASGPISEGINVTEWQVDATLTKVSTITGGLQPPMIPTWRHKQRSPISLSIP